MEGCEILNKKLILWLGLAAGAAATGIHLFTDGSAALALPCALISGVSCFMACKSKETQPLSSQGAISYENTSMLNDSLHKAYTDFDSIQESIKLIKDQQAKEHLLKLQSIAANMLHYMKKNPDRIPAAFQFIDYYQDRAASLACQYAELESTRLDNQDIRDTMYSIKNTLAGFEAAYNDQFTKMMSQQLMDINAELNLADTVMEDAGLKGSSPGTDYRYGPMPRDLGFKTSHQQELIPALLDWGIFYRYRSRPLASSDSIVTIKIITAAAALFFGSFGIHKFLLGKPKQGALYFVFSWCAIPGILGFIEAVRYILMSRESFFEKYYLSKIKNF